MTSVHISQGTQELVAGHWLAVIGAFHDGTTLQVRVLWADETRHLRVGDRLDLDDGAEAVVIDIEETLGPQQRGGLTLELG